MGFTYQQLIAAGGKAVPAQQTAASAAYQAFGKPAAPVLKGPGTNSPVVTGTDPRLAGINQGTAANFGAGLKDTLGNQVVKPAAQVAVRGFNDAAAAKDLIQNKGDTQFQQDISATRNLPLGIGPVAPTPDTLKGNLQNASDAFQTASVIDAATGLPEAAGKVSELADTASQKLSEIIPDIGSKAAQPDEIAAQAIKNPADLEQAFSEGRITAKNGKSVVAPSKPQQAMIDTLKPLAEEGKIKAPTSMQAQLDNGMAVQQEIDNEYNQLRQGLKNSNAIWNSNELKGRLDSVNIPDPVKNEPTLNKNAESVKNAIETLAQQADKKPEGLLDLRQNFDGYVKQNYGQNFFDKGRNSDPFHQYVYSVRDELNNFAADKLPDGKLPNGNTYKESLIKQHNLINASDEMSAKFANDFKGSETKGPIARWMQQNPQKARLARRLIEGVAIGSILGGSIYTLGKDIHNAVSGQ